MTQEHWKEGEGCGVLYLSLICLRKTKTKKTKKQKTKKKRKPGPEGGRTLVVKKKKTFMKSKQNEI